MLISDSTDKTNGQPGLGCETGLSYVLIEPMGGTMNTEEKITTIVDEYCADHPDKIIASVRLRDGRSIDLTLSDFENLQSAIEEGR